MHKYFPNRNLGYILNFKAKDDRSKRKLSMALNKIIKTLKINTSYDIPYLAGYSKDAKTIYIDKHIPKFMKYKNKKINIFRFLVLHEIIEKALTDHLGHFHYELAHQIATRAELAAVEGEGVSWKFYNKFIQEFVAEIRKEKNYHIPKDLDLKPYFDDKDKVILKRIRKTKSKLA